MKDLIAQLTELKASYKAQMNKGRALKTKAAQSKAFDKSRDIRREFCLLSKELDLNQFDMSLMNLMCPCAGPWFLGEATDFRNEGNYISFALPDGKRYVGEYSLIDDKCGFDNLAILAKQLN
jgi:hypothetical protein